MKTVRMPSGDLVPALGQGTWQMGEDATLRAQEIASLRAGLDLGLRLIDTAEMYGDGRTESLVGEAIAGRRDEVFLVSKVYPHNASRKAMPRSCTNSLRRLKTDRIDLYLLHWPGSVPLEETVDAFERLRQEGHIRGWGVSNLDSAEMQQLWPFPAAARCRRTRCCTTSRGVASNGTCCPGCASVACRSWRIRRSSRAALRATAHSPTSLDATT
jgi:diketogulonate reductase-like aldo/keto reductase